MADYLADKWEAVLANGYKIIPISPGEKYPVGMKGWQETEATPAVVKGWLANGYAHGGMGLLTKDTPAADLDIWDRGVGLELLRRIYEKTGCKPPKRTGQPPKCALLFRLEGEPFPKISSPVYIDSEGQKHKVEILGDGEQVVIFHIHPVTGKPYTWTKGRGNPAITPVADLPVMDRDLGEWIVDQFVELAEAKGWKRQSGERKPIPAENEDELHRAYREERRKPDWENKKEKIENALDAIDPSYWGDHDKWVDLAMALHWESEGSEEGFELYDDVSSNAPNYMGKKTPRQVWDSIKNNTDDPKTAGFIFKIAKEEYGWQWPKGDDDKPALAYFDGATVELDRSDDDLIDGVLSKGSLAVVYGDSSAGKTFFVLHMTYCLASGTEFFGRMIPKKGLVLYIAAESGEKLKNRVVAIRDIFGKNAAVRVITSTVNLYKDTADLKRIVEAAKEAESYFGMPVVAIIIDTLARATPGMNENASEDMGKAIGRLDELRGKTGAAVVLVHHSGKDQSKGARGWSGLRAAVDHEIEITRDEDIRIADLGSKQRDSQDSSGLVTFSLEVVELFERDDGRVVSTCVVEELNTDAPRGKKTKKMAKIPTQKKAVLDIINHLIDENHEVTIEDAREACIASPKVCDSENRKTRWSAFDRAIDWLTHDKLLFVVDGSIQREPEVEL